MEVPGLGVESELQLLAYTIAPAMQDLSRIDLHCSSWQCQILNPLREARDQTCNLIVPSWIRFCCTIDGNFRISISIIIFLAGERIYKLGKGKFWHCATIFKVDDSLCNFKAIFQFKMYKKDIQIFHFESSFVLLDFCLWSNAYPGIRMKLNSFDFHVPASVREERMFLQKLKCTVAVKRQKIKTK